MATERLNGSMSNFSDVGFFTCTSVLLSQTESVHAIIPSHLRRAREVTGSVLLPLAGLSRSCPSSHASGPGMKGFAGANREGEA